MKMCECNFGSNSLFRRPTVLVRPTFLFLIIKIKMIEKEERWEPSEEPDEARIDGFISTREDIGGTALEKCELFDNGLDFRCDLGGTRTRPNHCNSFASQIVIVSPLRCVPNFTLEVFCARDIGVLWSRKLSCC